ncbi:VWA domain-containing protein [Shewanella schlegeliana]|uniref:VWA domain-containing protein n=1 Tax=Shewanella schlegeliana TaxID=190308 RepID=A0ABS1SXC0_9GAMM|nr:VWA domain-containing protein [Shewanella schlegeliana]MBL4913169.1 VWA domain-containing protein [Shewanella schlegeliana]MCL1109125.1 VWA domain-containing protein [Shewanella schlegeliana]GIU38185.1 VWR domain protein in aerotolerance operon BatA [Shewanella schlegeliana]
MLTLAWPFLLLLLPLPLIFRKKQQQQPMGGHLLLPGASLPGQIVTTEKARQSKKRYWLVWCLLVLACARPLWVGEPIELPSKGRDLMLSVDLSGSMQIEDMVIDGKVVDRFTLIQHVISDFIERRKGDRIGLILFADHAYLQSPLTQDRRTVAQYLKEAQIGLVGKQTAIGEAIALGVKRFDKVEQSNRVLILLTDGSNNAGAISPEQATKIAAQRGVTIYTIGVGADVMERRTLFGKERVNPSMDLDESQLQQIAKDTGGQYFRARNTEELEQIYQVIDTLEPVSRDQLSYRPQSELFYWPLALALLASMVSALTYITAFRSSFRSKSQFAKGGR